jgi:KGK domain
MTDLSKQTIPNPQSVARCLDGTFVISDLLENVKEPMNEKTFVAQLEALHLNLKSSGYSREYYLDKIENFINKNTITENKNETFWDVFDDGLECDLLQPDRIGWQKGKLKICFEFIPEQSESMPTESDSSKTHSSPLDEIRQLSNQIASVGSIEQN